ncbi:MAG: low molecular weight protein-tyrosine-phosphatase [Paludibacter sp.]|jgi:protein-tyrosine phosphatase|nr:low molecular weight protein-tyrosine-phosphatase [Paludibacter sp.]
MSSKKILFVCLGNICRSPMAEGIFRKLVADKGLETSFVIDSAGTSAYHSGELPDARMRQHASRRGYHLNSRSRRIQQEDLEIFDLIIGMDNHNVERLFGMAKTSEQQSRIKRMTDFCRIHRATEIPDPYYGGDSGFEHVIDLLEDACEGLLEELT